MNNPFNNPKKQALLKTMMFAFALLTMNLLYTICYGQDGNAGIQEATNKVKGYFDTGTDLMYAIVQSWALSVPSKYSTNGMQENLIPIRLLRHGSGVVFSWSSWPPF